MADKEIIIHDVDVSGCKYACNTAFGKNGCKHPMMKNIYCFKNPNCYFKQLQRKTAECEKYEQALNEIKEICLKDVHTFADGTELRYDSLDDILDIISKAKEQ